MALIAGGCINLAFAFGSLIPALYLDRIGRRKPMSESPTLCDSPVTDSLVTVVGSIGMGLSLLAIAVLLSFQGTSKEAVTGKTCIAFFVTVSSPPDTMAQGTTG